MGKKADFQEEEGRKTGHGIHSFPARGIKLTDYANKEKNRLTPLSSPGVEMRKGARSSLFWGGKHFHRNGLSSYRE